MYAFTIMVHIANVYIIFLPDFIIKLSEQLDAKGLGVCRNFHLNSYTFFQDFYTVNIFNPNSARLLYVA